MNNPAAAHALSIHLESLTLIEGSLREEYSRLRTARAVEKSAPPRGPRASAERRGRPRANRRVMVRPARREDGVQRVVDPVPRLGDPARPRLRPRFELARVTALLLLLHVIVIGTVIIENASESSLVWRAIGGAVAIWIIFKCMAALSRRLLPRRRTSRRIFDRNCDRDIWL